MGINWWFLVIGGALGGALGLGVSFLIDHYINWDGDW